MLNVRFAYDTELDLIQDNRTIEQCKMFLDLLFYKHLCIVNSKRLVFALQLIFSGEYTKAMNKDWHSGHFCCWQCDESLTGQRYVLRDEHPYCIKCYESVFANGCEECNKIIGIDSKVDIFLSYDKYFIYNLLKLGSIFIFKKSELL